MTRYYLLIATDDMPNLTTEFYKLSVGESKKDLNHLAKLKIMAKQNNWYLAIWSKDVCSFVLRIAESLSAHYVQLNWVYMSISRFMSATIKNQSPPRQLTISYAQIQLINLIVYGISPSSYKHAGSQHVKKPKLMGMRVKVDIH